MIHVRDIAYVRYQVPDLDRQAAFLAGFGLYASHHSADAQHMNAHARG